VKRVIFLVSRGGVSFWLTLWRGGGYRGRWKTGPLPYREDANIILPPITHGGGRIGIKAWVWDSFRFLPHEIGESSLIGQFTVEVLILVGRPLGVGQLGSISSHIPGVIALTKS